MTRRMTKSVAKPAMPPTALSRTETNDLARPAGEKLCRRTKTRDALVIAARELMAARSKTYFTIDDVVQLAGVAKGSFYNHFADKDTLAEAVFTAIRSKEEHEVEAVNQSVREPAIRIARAMAVYVRLALTSPDEARIITQGQVDALSLQSPMNLGLARDLAEGIREGKLVTPSIDAGALLVIGQTAMLLSRLQTAKGRDAARSLAQQCIALTLIGLGLEHRNAHLTSTQAVEDIVRDEVGRPTIITPQRPVRKS